MTAVPAAAARVVLGAVLVLAAAASVLWAAYGPQGFWTLAWLAAMSVTVMAAVLGMAALAPRKGGEDHADTP